MVFGGDLNGGLLFGAVYKGLTMVEAYNKIPIDLANFGQHDFDFGPDHTIKLIKKSDFLWISTNLNLNYSCIEFAVATRKQNTAVLCTASYS